jgi:large subunit ribosomal protein L5e
LVVQAKNKYNTPKYRFAVRITNRKIIAQVIYASVNGDRVFAQAQSSELPRYGLHAGLTNYAAAYATGLLLARRLLKQVGLDDLYKGVAAPTGEMFDVYADYEKRVDKGEEIKRRPFKANLDVGLVRTTTGNRVFGALKGAVDGGLNVPHNVKRFPGYKESAKKKYDAAAHRRRIFGLHVQDYIKNMKTKDPKKYTNHFSVWDKYASANFEELYKSVHNAIKADPTFTKKTREHAPVHIREGFKIKTHNAEYPRHKKLSNADRKERVRQKILNAQSA